MVRRPITKFSQGRANPGQDINEPTNETNYLSTNKVEPGDKLTNQAFQGDDDVKEPASNNPKAVESLMGEATKPRLETHL